MRNKRKQTDLWNTISGLRDVATLDCCNWLKFQLEKSKFEQLAILTWGRWKCRMAVIYGKENEALNQNLDWCEDLQQEFKNSYSKLDISANAINYSGSQVTNALTPGTLQLEVDACVNYNLQQYGIRGAIKDFNGRMLLAFGQNIEEPSSVAEGELIAIQEGLKLVYARGIRLCRTVSDSLISVQAVIKSKEDYHYRGARVHQIKILMDATGTGELRHISRNYNSSAHNLARFASFLPNPFMWKHGNFPNWLEDTTV